MRLNELTITEYMNELAAKKSAPGGGSALGLVLETAACLSLMVCNFTIQKKGYENVQEKIIKISEELVEIRNEAHFLISEDGVCYQNLMDAYRSKDAEVISKASIYSCQIPYRLYCAAKRCENIAEELAKIGNKNLLSDAKIVIDLCRSCYHGCLLNIECNVNQILEEETKQFFKNIADEFKIGA